MAVRDGRLVLAGQQLLMCTLVGPFNRTS